MSVNWGMAGAVRPDPYGAYLDARDRREERGARLEAQQQQRTTRSANEAWARALAADDLAAARDIAAKAGSPEAVQSVNEQVQRRVRQEAIRFNTELRGIADAYAQDPQGAADRYARLYESTVQRATRWGLDRIHPEAMEQFRATYAVPGDPTFAQRLPMMVQNSTQSVAGLMAEEMTPEQWAENNRGPEWTDVPRDQLPEGARFGQHNPRTGRTEYDWAPQPNSAAREYGPNNLTSGQIEIEDRLSQRWMPVYNNFSEIRDSYQRINSMGGLQNSAGDLALVVAFTKMLDPGSVAREGEVSLTQSAASALAQAQNWGPRLLQGNTLLPPQVRAQLIAAANEMYGNYERAYNRIAQQTEDRARAYGAEPGRVMLGYVSGSSDQSQIPGGGDGDGQTARQPLPPISQRRDGRYYEWTDSRGQQRSGVWDAQTQTFESDDR